MPARFQSGDRVRIADERDGPAGVVRGVYRREIRSLEGIQEAFSYRVQLADRWSEQPIHESALVAASE